ncbi:MAG: hypothetical protein ACRD0K_19950 [Egibacteraceae bacterium]
MPDTEAKKGSPFSIRLTEATDRFVATEARRTKRSKSAIVEALTEEAARMRRFPGIGFRGVDADRRAWVIGTGLDVWQIIEAFNDFGSIEPMVAETDLSERQIRLALTYREHYPTELDEAIAENRRSLGELR